MTMRARKKDEEILTIGQVADFLKVTDRTIYRLAAAREIPAFKVGGSWRFRKADIDDWIALQAIKPGGQAD
jgi:excisionase family DNA binding protein